MTTQTITRQWRLSGAIVLVTLLLAAAFASHSHWNAFIQWCLATQMTLHRYLVMYLLQLNNHQYTGGLWLLLGSFCYGVLHAIGPGHGKFIVTTWLSTSQETPIHARVIPFLGSLMQGVSAILFVYILAMGFNLASGDLSESRWYVEKISAVMIGGFGVWLIIKAVKAMKPQKMKMTAMRPLHLHHPDSCGCCHHGRWGQHAR